MSKEERLEWEALNDKAEKKKELKFFFFAVLILLFSFIYALFGSVLIDKYNWHGALIVLVHIFISGFGVVLVLIGIYRFANVIYSLFIRAGLKKTSISAVRFQAVLLFSMYFFAIGKRLVEIIVRNSNSINNFLYSSSTLISYLGLYFLMFLMMFYYLVIKGLFRPLPKSIGKLHLELTRSQNVINLIFSVVLFPVLYWAIWKLYLFDGINYFGLEISGVNGKYLLLSTTFFTLVGLNFVNLSIAVIIHSTIFNHVHKLALSKPYVMLHSAFYVFLSIIFFLGGFYSNLKLNEKSDLVSRFMVNEHGQIYFLFELLCMSLTLLTAVIFWLSVRSLFLDVKKISVVDF